MNQINFSEGIAHKDLQCPECGAPMELLFSGKFRYKNGSRKPYYRCIHYPECSGSHGAHPNGAPLGHPADKETRDLRIVVHAELDRIFPARIMGGKERFKHRRREKIYSWLESKGFGHVSSMNKEECRKVLKLIAESYPQK